MKEKDVLRLIDVLVNSLNSNEDDTLNLLVRLKVNVTTHPLFKHLFHFSYQPAAEVSSTIVQICRGLVLAKINDEWQYHSMPYARFFCVQQESIVDKINLAQAIIEEKADGTMIHLHYDKVSSSWITSTTGSLLGEGPTANPYLSFKDLFWRAFGRENVNLLNEDYAYLFELMAPENQVVLAYDKDELVLHGIRNRATKKLMSRALVEDSAYALLKIKTVRVTKQYTPDDLLLEHKDIEGFVIKGPESTMAKIKVEWYMEQFHKLRGSPFKSINRYVWADNKSDLLELISMRPYTKDYADKEQKLYDSFKGLIELALVKLESLNDAKTIALHMTKLKISKPVQGLIWLIIKQKMSVSEAITHIVLAQPDKIKTYKEIITDETAGGLL